jgi:hypothetical protein
MVFVFIASGKVGDSQASHALSSSPPQDMRHSSVIHCPQKNSSDKGESGFFLKNSRRF